MSPPTFPRVTLLTTLAILGLFVALGPAPERLVYDRDLVAQGEVWRLITSHLVHSDSQHLRWNLVATAMLGIFLEAHTGWRLLVVSVSGLVLIDGFLLLNPAVAQYCGMSGVLNTWLAGLLAISAADRQLRPLAIATGIGAVLKIYIESRSGSALFTDTAWQSIPASHLAGFIGGVVWSIMYYQGRKT